MQSKRFPKKLMQNFLGDPIIHHVIRNALNFDFLEKIVVSTDSREIYNYVTENFIYVDVVNSGEVSCGTERIYKYYEKRPSYDYYISIPSDEPCIDANEINNVVANNKFNDDEISSFYSEFYCEDDLRSPLSCKIIIYNGRMI